MILKRKKPTSKFYEFMLYQEADDEPPKTNRKTIELKAGDGRRPDLSKGAEIEDDEPEDADEMEPSDDEDLSAGAEMTDEPSGEGEDGGDEDFSDGADLGGGDGSGDDTGGDTGEDSSGEGEDGGDEDFSDGADLGGGDGSGDDTGGDTGEDSSGEGNDSSSDGSSDDKSSDEQIRKYVLYRKFLKLNKILDSNIEVLNNVLSDDIAVNKSYKKIISKLKDANMLLSEYMIIRFQNASYIQSMLFYQRILAIVNINFNALSDIQKEIVKNNKK